MRPSCGIYCWGATLPKPSFLGGAPPPQTPPEDMHEVVSPLTPYSSESTFLCTNNSHARSSQSLRDLSVHRRSRARIAAMHDVATILYYSTFLLYFTTVLYCTTLPQTLLPNSTSLLYFTTLPHQASSLLYFTTLLQ